MECISIDDVTNCSELDSIIEPMGEGLKTTKVVQV